MNEKELTKEILAAEKDAKENKQQSYIKAAPVLQFREDRSADPLHKPAVIDIAGNLNNTGDIRLSDIATSIKYVRMQPVPDSTIPVDLKYKYHLMDNYIVALNLYGIHLYSKEGVYLRPIVKNELTGVIVAPGQIMFYNDYTVKGGGMTVRSEGSNLLYNYKNTMTGENYIMKFDCSLTQMTEEYKFDPENPDRISGVGEVALDLNHGNSLPPESSSRQGMFGGPLEWLSDERGVFLLDNNSYAVPVHEENLMVIFNARGDTLSTFSRFEKLVNFTKSLKRGTDDGVQYENQNFLYVRPEFNDTVFRVIPPNRLYPVYVLNLGGYKATKQEGADPDFDLTGKIIPEGWVESAKYIFITFTKDDYDCPDNRKHKKVKIYHAIYSKSDGRFTVIRGDPFDYAPEILENNLDGGIPVWPSSYMMGRNDEILMSLKGKDIKDRVKSGAFNSSSAPAVRKQELIRLAGSVSDMDDVLMIIK